MKQHLNVKNKVLIFVFALIILLIVGILIYSANRVGFNNSSLYIVTDKSVLFADDYSTIDTKSGGSIKKNWNSKYHYISNNNESYLLGDTPVVYDVATGEVAVIGEKYQINIDGSVSKIEDIFKSDNRTIPYFFKLQDRKYLIIYKEITDSNKTIYTKNYLLVDIDKQGNASLLNDALNVKTINPIKLMFENYVFDVANEILYYNENSVDLKQIIGSTNQYVKQEKKEVYEYDSKELIESYNELVNNFTQYANNHNYSMSANNKISENTIIINNNTNNNTNNNGNNNSNTNNNGSNNNNNDNNNSNTNNNGSNNNNNANNNTNNDNGSNTNNGSSSDDDSGTNATDTNKTELFKMVSLRGVVTSVAYIDVTYTVTDPENKYQAVYLLVTGKINNELTTQKIMLDKYNTKYRIPSVAANSEYTISLGYIEIVMTNDEKSLVDNIEDVINVRTRDIEYNLSVERISSGKVYFNYKMPTSYAFETVDIAFIVDDVEKDSMPIVYNSMISSKGFSGSFEMPEGSIYELRIKNAKYHNRAVETNIYKKFTLTT